MRCRSPLQILELLQIKLFCIPEVIVMEIYEYGVEEDMNDTCGR